MSSFERSRKITCSDDRKDCGIPKIIIHRILLVDLQMSIVCPKMVPKVLMSEMEEQRLLKFQEFHGFCETDPEFSGKVITMDEARIF